MLFVFIALWSVSATLWIMDFRKSSFRWLGAVSFCGGAGALAALIGDHLLPHAQGGGWPGAVLRLLQTVQTSASLTQYYGLPYTFVLFALHYHSRFLPARRIRYVGWAALLPIAASLLLHRPPYPINYPLTALWAVPYIAFGTYLVLAKKETYPPMIRNHRVTSLAVVPAVVLCSVMNYLLPSLGIYEMWRYNTWIILVAFLIFLFAIFKYGFLGMRFEIEKRRLDTTFRAITSGTAILNHAIKNDVGKMKLFGENILRYAEQTGQRELAEDARVILDASRHIREMIARVHEHTRDLELRPERCRLGSLVEQTLDQWSPSLGHIRVRLSHKADPELIVDGAQIAEVLNNLIANAVEAMPEGGELAVRLHENRKHATLEIRDTGNGMTKAELSRAMEPFYTTKGSRTNFGLGLSYCYQVMEKHGGTLRLQSRPGEGTGVLLVFPKTGGYPWK